MATSDELTQWIRNVFDLVVSGRIRIWCRSKQITVCVIFGFLVHFLIGTGDIFTRSADLPKENTGVLENPLDKEQSDLHNQIALFLIAAYESEHSEQPHAVDLTWMSSVVRRIANQRNQTVAFNIDALERYVRTELERQGLPFDRIDNVVFWSRERLQEMQTSHF